MSPTQPEVSVEFFPPKTDQGREHLYSQIDAFESIKPAFYSVTFGAGGSTQEPTFTVVEKLRKRGLNTAPHLSCIGSTRDSITAILDSHKQNGINNIVALRGDLPEGSNDIGEFRHANELVAHIREHSGDHFTIHVAGYPEYHPESDSPISDIKFLKQKVDAGANNIITQYFFNADAYYAMRENCTRAGITTPITAGIMPITNYAGLVRFSDACGAEIPRWIRLKLESLQHDTAGLQQFGLDVVCAMCEKLVEYDVPGFHFYSMNKAESTVQIYDSLFGNN